MKIGMLVFPDITATDYVAPADLLVRIPGASLSLVWKHTDPIRTELGWEFRATRAMADCPQYDMLVVPGGPGVAALFEDRETVDFLARQGRGARWVVGICTGPLLLGVAGLLEGYEATCHWASHELLAMVGATPRDQRVVVDRNRITGAGVTSGIDCALRAIAQATDDDTARAIQLFAEYDPQPPFDSGAPAKAPAHIVEAARARVAGVVAERRAILARIGRTAPVTA
ncbi:AraC family transcriptional regulator [Variovorax paradoxus]|jgi:cyclohexyl-isocyanide hydratase|uniref:DJ-1/PfpI family protein n=1 Tax=Variovorax paradoxus TaxID=34073 RepID=UPI0006E55C13|nr:AraC family transcriptional regulator [Variovorax paradoxus]KPV03751.1 AraC family transcriptional regulator [Variovorax paradoxus]KPV04805.1 AraC family transcriptional regulator [Variovorax paradoxus]KPV20527.1 AraC family transcriptional regulator [Variovorax paradoxus]KPV31218.1 AraC family transcriptional regulator [Variovorax paradoxus]